MFRRYRLALVLLGTCLIVASGAAAAPSSFTVGLTPSHVKPSSSAAYTVILTNNQSSDEKGADRATIFVEGFQLVGSPTASVTGCGSARAWGAEVAPDGHTITLQRTGPSANNLCPGGILTVVFTASAPPGEGSYTWPTAMFRGDEAFTGGPSPTVIVDGTAPETAIGAGPPSPTASTSASFTFSSEAGARFECSLDSAAFTACTSPKTYSGLPGGPRTFAVRATDAAGNTDATPATYGWTIDLAGPPTTIGSGPPSATNSSSASFTFSSEPGTTFECSLDGVAFSACTSPKGYDNLSDGAHVFAVRAIDSASNTGPPSSHNWTIDTRPPAVSLMSAPAALSNRRSAAFGFSADEPSSFMCQLDGGASQPCNSRTSYLDLGDGSHTFAVKPIDAVGNTGLSSSYTWTIDATAPETTLASAPRSRATTKSATFRFRANEPVTFECKLDGAAFALCTSPKSYSRLKKSRHTFVVRATDAAGNIDVTPAAHRWTIAAAPRTVKKTSALLAPQGGVRVKAPPLLRWRRVTGAVYYNVQLYRGGLKVLSAWPTRPRLQLRARWTYLGRQQKLSAGSYKWYVWPARSRDHYGALLGQSTFIVTAR